MLKGLLINKVQNLIIKASKINDGRLRYKIDKNQIRKIIGLKIKKIKEDQIFIIFFNKNIVMLSSFRNDR